MKVKEKLPNKSEFISALVMISAWNHTNFWDSRSKLKWHFDSFRDCSHCRMCALGSWAGHSKWTKQYYPRSGAGLSPGGSVGNESIYKAGDTGDVGSILGTGRSPEEKMATHSIILAWRILWTEESGRLQSMGRKSWTRLSN